MFSIRQDPLEAEPVLALLAAHLDGMHRNSPPGAVFALGLAGLRQPGITVWTAWSGDRLAGIGALRLLGDGVGEVKSMRTHPAFLRMGAASALLDVIVEAARASGVRSLCLETGRGEAFEPALALYRRHGFKDGAAFGDYRESAFNRFLRRDLSLS
ncbi:GNAT family N-acetyltransferase [Rhizosaccharibacter radicis]|uniref:GNAT family N-acetyltransferase n=1 Tax=Rhizosaccharibacter radicis TaxID=2782605 RepID=A0ABT1VSU6_9PROT|nr:GNAT family N-acetyltransferase [Acetobacteraceae bacterium KSS12]